MDQLIPIINELQDTYAKLNMPFINLPQIVIIGAQSAGKSSVLENIVKQEFLPRGTGIVTRCPLVLQLVNDPDSSRGPRGRFLHTGDLDYYDFVDIKEEIIRQTDALAGSEKNITNQPINLKIYSHEFPNLTLIDLPGLTKVAVESQPKDIDEQIKAMCLQYARKENSIILAISAANVDLANSDSIRFAEELDPEGKRTLCVITKLDLMDKGTNAYEILTGRILPKELGYIGVVSRSQEDIMRGKPIEESLVDEKEFFEFYYPDLAKKNGTYFLTNRLNMLLKKHIRKCLPALKDTIKDKIHAANCRLELLGPEIVDKSRLIPQFLTDFNRAYVRINDGNFDENLNEIRGGALISEIIYEKFPKILMGIDIENQLTEKVVMTAIRNACATDKMTFIRQGAFICLIREQIQKLSGPSLRCIEDVFETMKEFVNLASKSYNFENFPNLIGRILQETGILIRQSYGTTKSLVENLIKSEKLDVLCSHPNFKLGYALENMNFQNLNGPNEGCAAIAGPDHLKDNLLDDGFKIVCQSIDKNLADFSRMLIYYIHKSRETMTIVDLLVNKVTAVEEKRANLQVICDRVFIDHPTILALKDVIIEALLNDAYKLYDALTQHELDNHINKLSELRTPVDRQREYMIMKNLVIEYFNMVRQNICYYIPKLIKAFLVIHVRNELMYHLQLINADPNVEFLLFEAENTFRQRKETKILLKDLENVKQRIDDIYCGNL